jgi:hypothetical protein
MRHETAPFKFKLCHNVANGAVIHTPEWFEFIKFPFVFNQSMIFRPTASLLQ